MGRVQNRIAIVTGGASGIGAAACETLAREGARVICADISERRGVGVAEALSERGYEVAFKRLDIGEAISWQHLIEATREQFGPPDILVNGAYSGRAGAIDTMTEEDWVGAFRVTAHGVFLGMNSALPVMRRGGAIVNIASVAAYRGWSQNAAYAAAKAAVVSLSKSAAVRLAEAGRGIRVNVVAPGLIETPATGKMFEAFEHLGATGYTREVMTGRIPMGEIGQPEDIANAILFLASDEARYITGAELVVDGGLLAPW